MQVFISYKRKDVAFAVDIFDAVQSCGFTPWLDTKDIPAVATPKSKGWEDAIFLGMKNSEVVIGVITPESLSSQNVLDEWGWALSNKRRLILLLLEDVPEDAIPPRYIRIQRIDFRTKREEGFRKLKEELYRSARELGFIFSDRRDFVSSTSYKFLNVPPLPEPNHYLPRQDVLTAIKNIVIGSATSKTAIYGMGGIGKSVIAAAIAHDADVQKTFPDGIVWVSIGIQRQDFKSEDDYRRVLILKQSDLAKTQSSSNSEISDIESGRSYLQRLFNGKAYLFILDNVWDVEQVRAFDLPEANCRILFTTRDREIITRVGAAEYVLGLLSSDDSDNQALLMLAKYAGQSVDSLPAEAKQVAVECGNLPLALALAGSRVNPPVIRWEDILQELRKVNLEFFETKFVRGYAYSNLLKALVVSVDLLDDCTRERFLSLAVFPKATTVPISTVVMFWEQDHQDSSSPIPRASLERLIDSSLVQLTQSSGPNEKTQIDCVILHDLVYDYVSYKTLDKTALYVVRPSGSR